MSGVDLLTRLFNAYKFTLPLGLVRDDPDLSVLSDLGIIENRQSGATVLCDACDYPHTVKIQIDPITDELGWRCPDSGFVSATSDQLDEVRLLPGVLAARMSEALQCQRYKEKPLIDGLLWKIGWYEFDHNDVNVFLACRFRDAEDFRAIAVALQTEPGLRNGLIIGPDVSGTSSLTLAKCRFAAIADVLGIEHNTLALDQARVATIAGIEKKRKGGRPPHAGTDAAIALIRKRFAEGTYADSKRAEAQAVMKELGENSPGQTKLYEIISDVWTDQ